MASLHALLIGVDGFDPERFPDGGWIPPLAGAVNDAERMRDFLVEGPPALPAENVRMLISPNPLSGRSRPAPEDLPTLANLRAEISALGERARGGDQVLIHFSGHGARVESRAPVPKQESGWDECLVPCDVGDSDYLRDWEVHGLLHDLAKRGLQVVVVLDCCHSAGVVRSPAIRRVVPSWHGPSGAATKTVAPDGGENGVRRTAGGTRNLVPSAGWWPPPPGSVLLAACRSTELAREASFQNVGTSGALTHHLLTATGSLGSRATYGDLHRLVLARIHGQFPTQTPVIEGEADLRFLGLDRWAGLHGVAVMDTRWRHGTAWVLLGTGLSQGVRAGARFTLRPPRSVSAVEGDPDAADGAGVQAEVVEAGGGTSWARVDTSTEAEDLRGWTAVLVDPGPRAIVRRVVVEPLAAVAGSTDEETEETRALLAAVRTAVADGRSAWLEPAGEGGADLGVTWSGERGLEILDPAGQPLPVQGGRIRTVEALLDRLNHFARYAGVRALENPDRSSRVRNALRLELFHRKPAWPGGPGELLPLATGAGVPCGDEVVLRIHNDSDLELQTVALDLQPDWGITQIHPTHGSSTTVWPGGCTEARLEVDLPFEGEEGVDLLKVVATTELVDFSWLVLPALGSESVARRSRSGRPPAGPLESLFAQLTADRPATRTVRAVPPAGGDWAVAEVELRVVRTEADREVDAG